MARLLIPDSVKAYLRRVFYSEPNARQMLPARLFRGLRVVWALLREARAVYTSQNSYLQHHVRGDNIYALRRSIHRLEKGLIRRPPRRVFAIDYIFSTVEQFKSQVELPTRECDREQLLWARDVLDRYFQVTHSDPEIANARALFESVRLRVPPSDNRSHAPFQREIDGEGIPSYNQILDLSHRRRSVRWFQDRSVPREVTIKALRVAGLSPSACNRQPYRFRIFDETELARKVSRLAVGAKGFNDNFPAIAVVTGDLSAYYHEKDRHIIYIDASLASMSFLLALEAQGVSSCCINWPDVHSLNQKMQSLLGLETYERVIMLIAFGYADPDGLVPFSGKREIGTMAIFNEVVV